MKRVFSPFFAAIAAAVAAAMPKNEAGYIDPRLKNLEVEGRRTGKHSHARGGAHDGYGKVTPRGGDKRRARIIHRSRVTLQQAAGLESRAISQECARRKAPTASAAALIAMAEKRIAFLRKQGNVELAKDIERRVSRSRLILNGIV